MAFLGLYEDKLPQPVQDFLKGYNGEVTGPIVLTEQRKQHILYGDSTGGGHKHGVGAPCKSEFPADWDDEKIITVVEKIAANDNLRWVQQNNGYYTGEAFEDNLKVRVVLGPQKQKVITSYPINVARNPCPYKEPANDNFGNK